MTWLLIIGWFIGLPCTAERMILVYAFLNPESGKIVVYDDFLQASLQALLVNQRFIAAFGEDEPYIIELAEGKDDGDEA